MHSHWNEEHWFLQIPVQVKDTPPADVTEEKPGRDLETFLSEEVVILRENLIWSWTDGQVPQTSKLNYFSDTRCQTLKHLVDLKVDKKHLEKLQ